MPNFEEKDKFLADPIKIKKIGNFDRGRYSLMRKNRETY